MKKSINAKTIEASVNVSKKALQTMNKLHVEALKENELYNQFIEAFQMNVIYNAHVEALNEQSERVNALLTNKERNASKRQLQSERVMSTFCKSLKTSSQAFRIDEAFKTFHSMKELTTLLDDCSESRIKSHRSFLQTLFSHTCKYVEEVRLVDSVKKTYFKFELI